MYGMFGGCTTLFHAMIRYRLVAVAVALAGFVHLVNAEAPGNLMGTDGVLMEAQKQIVLDHPGLPAQVEKVEIEFEKLDVVPTEDQIRYVLGFTDACTDTSVQDVLSNPDRRREAAWLFYLDTWSREGPDKANALWKVKQNPPPLTR